MVLRGAKESAIGQIAVAHHRTLPFKHRHDGRRSYVVSWVWFFGVPLAAAGVMGWAGFAASGGVVNGLLAGTGVLTGLLVQLLAGLAARTGDLADRAHGAANPHTLRALERLRIARANVAYASAVSIVMVLLLGCQALMKTPPRWMTFVDAVGLIHLVLVLLLVLIRINDVATGDDITVRTAHTRSNENA